MARVLALITHPESRRRAHCRSSNEWFGCWWGETDEESDTNPSYYNIALFRIHPNGKSEDVLYGVDEGGEGIARELERTIPCQNLKSQNYLLLQDATHINQFLRQDRWRIRADGCGIVLIKGEGESEEIATRIRVVRDALIERDHQLCFAAHGDKSHESFGRYTSGGDYWDQLIQLRYGGASLRNEVPTRSQAFDRVWKELRGSK